MIESYSLVDMGKCFIISVLWFMREGKEEKGRERKREGGLYEQASSAQVRYLRQQEDVGIQPCSHPSLRLPWWVFPKQGVLFFFR